MYSLQKFRIILSPLILIHLPYASCSADKHLHKDSISAALSVHMTFATVILFGKKLMVDCSNSFENGMSYLYRVNIISEPDMSPPIAFKSILLFK